MDTCGHCRITKNLEQFNKNRSRKDGIYNICKECLKVIRKNYREKIQTEKPKTHIKITCECGVAINEAIYANHIKTQYHLAKVATKVDRAKIKRDRYEINKTLSNCCSRCFNTNIIDYYFNKETNTCLCCDEIYNGLPKECRFCKEIKDLTEFERPYLYRCKICASKRARTRILCECGDYTSLVSKTKHIQSNKHLMKIRNINNYKDE